MRRHRHRQAPEALDKVYSLFPVLKERSAQLAGTLSGGERQMLAIGRALVSDPRLLILDEPSAGLAPKLVEELYDALAQIKQTRSCALVLAEQNVPMAARVADSCLLLEQGRVVLSGPMEQVARDPRLGSAYLGI
jgi:branched-chain amino acid transport system ATP-binding protein